MHFHGGSSSLSPGTTSGTTLCSRTTVAPSRMLDYSLAVVEGADNTVEAMILAVEEGGRGGTMYLVLMGEGKG